jgi:hypothetical protein
VAFLFCISQKVEDLESRVEVDIRFFFSIVDNKAFDHRSRIVGVVIMARILPVTNGTQSK